MHLHLDFFTWKNTATVTGGNTTSTSNVIATTLIKIINDEDNDDLRVTKLAVHSFDAIAPGVITWDPELGADSQNPDAPSTSGASSTVASAMTIMIAALVALFAL